jgi:hypothetical protein
LGVKTHQADIMGAILWYSQATMLVKDGEYDAHFEPRHSAVIVCRADAPVLEVSPLEGFKGDTNSEGGL